MKPLAKKTIKVRSTLQGKFTLIFLLISATTIMILGNLALYLVSYSHRIDVSNLETQLIGQVQKEIERYLTDTLGIIDLRVSSTNTPYIDLSQQEFIAEGLLEEQETFDEVSFISVVDETTPGRLQRAVGTETLRLTRSGTRPPKDVSQLEFFKTARGGERYVGDVEYTREGPFVRIATPVLDRDGNIIEVLSARVNLQKLITTIERYDLGTDGYVILVDATGKTIAGKNIPKGTPLGNFTRIQSVLNGQNRDALSDDDYYIGYGNAVPSVGAGVKIKDIGWGIFVEWALADANSIVKDVEKTMFTVMFGISIASLLFAYLVARRITQPIKMLKIGAGLIAEGKLDTQLSIKTNDELTELGQSFNTMTKGLKELETLRTEYTHIMTHELRAPLTAIRGFTSLLSEEYASLLPDEGKRFIKMVERSSNNLSQLINDLLEIAKLDSGKLSMEIDDVDLQSVIKNAVDELSVTCREKNIDLQYKPLNKTITISADPTRLKQVITNLLSNAIKYNKENGSITISVAEGANNVNILITDTGIGMTKEQLSHLFEKFYRAKDQTKIVGTGLGLYITKMLTTAMGGSITALSEQGNGSTFALSFPKKQQG